MSKGKTIIAIPTGSGSIFIEEDQIVCCLAEGSYTKLILLDESEYLITKNLNKVLAGLSQELFVRIHKSHFINIKHITNYTSFNGKHEVTIKGDRQLTISRSWKETFFKRFRTL